jgi:hypothetical protein
MSFSVNGLRGSLESMSRFRRMPVRPWHAREEYKRPGLTPWSFWMTMCRPVPD